MEPDILATPSDRLTRDPERSASIAAASAGPAAERVNGHESAAHAAGAIESPLVGLNGNGHHGGLNGHTTNGLAANGLGLAARVRGVATTAPAEWRIGGVVQRPVERSHGLYLRGGKRLLDILGASACLVLSSPLLLLAALAIKLESRGPVFYKSTRIGRGGRPFTFYKLRSMVNGADRHRHHLTHLNEADGPVFKITNDPRVTRVGRFLRSSSIDEIPQFFHVLSGDMSLVGPRPPIPEEVAQYEPWQLRRLDVRPGLTCLWQISGRSRIGFQEWMRLDLEYIKRQSAALDAKILLRTIPAVLSREGAY
jgi:lipopolysaccharide/colanic/teichoic acid biosynthesis glycosyltransferase